jgi:nucleoside-diphosphate-sugar epimerase
MASTELFGLTGKVAVVTGATRGLGRAIALGLSGAGARVVIRPRLRRAYCGRHPRAIRVYLIMPGEDISGTGTRGEHGPDVRT